MATRISGLSSGMDIDSMVQSLMKMETAKVDKVKQQKQIMEWKQDDYRATNTKLLALRTAAFDLKLQGNFQTKKVVSSDEAVLTATASTAVPEGANSITVHQLASGVYKGSTAKLGSSDTKTTLKEQLGDTLADTISFTLEGYDGEKAVSKEFTFDTTTQSMSDVVDAINEADIGIKASYDAGVDRFFLTTAGTGSNYKIQATADNQNFLTNTLKLDLTVGTTLDADDQGKNAIVDFNGVTGLEFSSNQFTLNNISFNVKKEGKVQLSVSNDVDAVVNKIKSFVEVYNSAMDLMANETSETRYRDYTPLTDAQREEMTDKQIEQWEEKAKSGLLKGDSLITGTYNQIRGAAMGAISNLTTGTKYTSLSSIGINTTSWYDNGKLEVNEEDLREALSKDPEGVMNLFTQTQDSSSTADTRGIASRIYDQVNSAITTIKDKAGNASDYVDNSSMGKSISDYQDRIDDLTDRLADIEDRYYNQFTALETAIQNMNTQSQWLSQQFNTGS
jgi:flagellar hook-associated protein 2